MIISFLLFVYKNTVDPKKANLGYISITYTHELFQFQAKKVPMAV